MLTPTKALALMFDPSLILDAQGLTPDAWQRKVLLDPSQQMLLNCSRQSGKSTVVAAIALHTALFKAKSLTLLIAPSQRQAHELFRKILDAYNACGRPVPTSQDCQTLSKLELANGSRIIGLPSKERTLRSFSKVNLILIDEAARVPDDLYKAIRPMLAVSKGRLIALSTPFGQRGWFHYEYVHGSAAHWQKVQIPWQKCPRILPSYIAQEQASLGENWVGQEFECLFTALEGLVYPDFEKAVWDVCGFARGTLVGGIDFGWRNPFAAIWGALDHDDVLWIIDERYLRETALHLHCAFLKKLNPTLWYADPSGPTEIQELRTADIKVKRAVNDIRLGVAAVTARIRTGRLRISRTNCPNLIAESKLYRYPTSSERQTVNENPIDDNNHALAALRYLVSTIDSNYIAKLRRQKSPSGQEVIEPSVLATSLESHAANKVNKAREHVQNIWHTAGWNDDDQWEKSQ